MGTIVDAGGDTPEEQYRYTVEQLDYQNGMLGEILKKAGSDIQNPATLKRQIADLIEPIGGPA